MTFRLVRLLALAFLLAAGGRAVAQSFIQFNQYDPIGIDALRAYDPTLTGSGQVVAQPEADFNGPTNFEVNYNAYGVGQPVSKFIYISASGTAAGVFTNDVGAESSHADTVADNMYGTNAGTATGISTIYNYDANYFYNTLISGTVAIPARIVNQSFETTDDPIVDVTYDNYAATYDTLFISGAGDGGAVTEPGSMFNGIGVADYDGATSTGTTGENPAKPDITAPGGATSYSTPYVSGVALVLLQAATRGDAGAGTVSDASNALTLKALLLNGADKPGAGMQAWSNSPTTPLDLFYGTGIVNAYNSYMNLSAGEYGPSAALSGSIHSVTSTNYLPDEGWDLDTITNSGSPFLYTAQSNHYSFDLSSSVAPAFTLTATLTWFIHDGASSINLLDLYLYDETDGSLVNLSDTTDDNVQYLYVTGLAPGEYDLAVLKNGGESVDFNNGTVVSATETYALAYNFIAVPEPSTVSLLMPAGAAALLWRGKLRRGKSGGTWRGGSHS